jgi:hypothetical protein
MRAVNVVARIAASVQAATVFFFIVMILFSFQWPFGLVSMAFQPCKEKIEIGR